MVSNRPPFYTSQIARLRVRNEMQDAQISLSHNPASYSLPPPTVRQARDPHQPYSHPRLTRRARAQH
eukprot:scaffold1168_cov123-Isochrysis_galbana.AAC.2